MLIADAAMIVAWFMTPITLKMAAGKEGRERIAGNPTSGDKTVSG